MYVYNRNEYYSMSTQTFGWAHKLFVGPQPKCVRGRAQSVFGPQATKDLSTEATMALDAPAHLRAGMLEEASAAWGSSATDFWRAHTTETKAKPVPKLQRTKAWSWLAATQHQLQAGLGVGWEHFLLDENEEKSTKNY
jgi:hypothetical protein